VAFSTSEDSSGPLSSNQLLGFREGNAHISGRDARAHSHLPAVMAPDASHADGAFAECHELIEEMRRIYSTDEDAVKVRQLNQQFAEVRELCDTREAHMQTVIREMVKRVEKAEKKVNAAAAPDAEHQKRVAEAEAEKRAAGENLTNMEKEAQSLEELQEELKSRGATLKVRRAEVDSVAAEEVPRAKHELSLYAHISKISWQYEVTDRIAGRVNAHEGKDLKVIDFAVGDRSEYHLTNDLWNMIG
jgi:kinetochore protein Spc24